MSVQTNRRHWSRRALIPSFALVMVMPLASCGLLFPEETCSVGGSDCRYCPNDATVLGVNHVGQRADDECDADPNSDPNDPGRFAVTVQLNNERSQYWNGTAVVRGESAHMTIQGLTPAETPPCCLVAEGTNRQKDILVKTGEVWFVRAYSVIPGVPPDFTHYAQTVCVVTAAKPTGSQPKPTLVVRHDNSVADQLVCNGGWRPNT